MSDLIERLRSLSAQVRPFDEVQALTYSDCADELDKAADEIERLTAESKGWENDWIKAMHRVESLTKAHKEAELLWWNEKGELEDRIAELEALCEFHIAEAKKQDDLLLKENAALKAALHKIRTEPGDARDCRYIAGHALAAEQENNDD